MNWLMTAVLCIVLGEMALRLPLLRSVAMVHESSRKALRVLQAKAVSDHWKEKAMAAYARTTFVASGQLAGFLILLFAVAAGIVITFECIAIGFQDFLLSWPGIVFSVIFMGVYWMVRKTSAHAHL